MSVITATEFAHLLASSVPPPGWGRSITVALSGGPDSLCLLYLLRNHRPQLPLRSITVDHALQPTSHASALRTHARAISMGVPNVVLPAEWPSSNPVSGQAIEEAARNARYRALWRGLWDDEDAGEPKTLMFAHHADDQLETVLMRLMRGTNTYGMGGMRALRRWGMSTEEKLRGMRTWLARPLLNIPKDRILATCDAHNLTYEQDVTNFMPDLTVRNAIRHALSNPTSTTNKEIANAIEQVHILSGGERGSVPALPLMRSYVGRMAARVREVDKIVTTYLSQYTRPSPPSTLLLVTPDVEHSGLEPDAAYALVHRILRYVSPHPWGSLESEGGRRGKSVQSIVRQVLGSITRNGRDNITGNGNSTPAHGLKAALSHGSRNTPTPAPFTTGAQVLWTPVIIRPDGSTRRRTHTCGGTNGWLVSRLPLSSTAPSLELEVSSLEVLWDNRFLVRMPSSDVPGSKVVIRPNGRLVLPQVVRIHEDGREEQVEGCRVTFVRELSAV